MKTTLKYILFGMAFCFCHLTLLAQNKNIDSLLTLLKTDKADTNKVIHLLNLADKYSNQNSDSAIFFAEQSKNIAEKLNNKKFVADALSAIGWNNFVKGDIPEALDNYFTALKIDEELKDKSRIAKQLGN